MFKSFYKMAVLTSIASFAVFTSCQNPAIGGNGGNGGNGGGGDKPISYIGTKAPNVSKKVGDIVFTDGSATEYTSSLVLTESQKAKAIAVIFYVGTECSYNGEARTLGVALKRCKDTGAWCKGYGRLTYITTILPSTLNGSDNLSKAIIAASRVGTDKEEDYPAFYTAKNYGKNELDKSTASVYKEGWYLPSEAEIRKIMNEKQIIRDACFTCVDGSIFSGDSNLWTSSQTTDKAEYAQLLTWQNGSSETYNIKSCNKTTANPVVAIREF